MAKGHNGIEKDEVKSTLDQLFSTVENFRTTENFRQMLDFVSKFKTLSPFNAFLVYQQRPGCRYVLNASAWRKNFNRATMPNARPLIILVPFGPVDYVYDISDTYSIDKHEEYTLFDHSDKDILDILASPFQTKGYEPNKEMERLSYYMGYHGIALDSTMRAGSEYAGKIEIISNVPKEVTFDYKNQRVSYPANYLLSIREGAQAGEAIATAAHELGHLFCHHLPALPTGAWERRNLTHTEREFEAEAVSYIVCTRLNIATPSAEYLNGYYTKNTQIPRVSVETIFSACNMILKMIEGIQIKDGLLYKFDDHFKKMIQGLK